MSNIAIIGGTGLTSLGGMVIADREVVMPTMWQPSRSSLSISAALSRRGPWVVA